jgi:hypothetical protein
MKLLLFPLFPHQISSSVCFFSYTLSVLVPVPFLPPSSCLGPPGLPARPEMLVKQPDPPAGGQSNCSTANLQLLGSNCSDRDRLKTATARRSPSRQFTDPVSIFYVKPLISCAVCCRENIYILFYSILFSPWNGGDLSGK